MHAPAAQAGPVFPTVEGAGAPASRPRHPALPERRLLAALVASDAALVAGSLILAHWWRDAALAAGAMERIGLAAVAAAVAAILFFSAHRLYDARTLVRGWVQITALLRAWLGLAAVAILVIFLAKPEDPLRSRLALAGFLFLGILLTGVTRVGFWRSVVMARWGDAIRGARIILGTGPLAERLAVAAAQNGRWEPRLLGFVDDRTPSPARAAALPARWLGGPDAIDGWAEAGGVTDILVAREELTRGDLVRLGHRWMDQGLHVTLASSAFEVMVARASTRVLGDVPLVELRPSPQRGPRLAGKRILDVAAVLIGGVILLPLLAGVALAVRFTSPGPMLFRQTRIGRGGRPFTMLKFRSMVVNNDDGHHREYVRKLMNGQEGRVDPEGRRVFKLVDDPRVTPIGRFLRRSSLDELPQLWNVLRGDMSLVGPRPCLPYEWDLYQDWQRRRMDALPGITGLWQVVGRSRVSFEDMVLLDLHYIATWSLAGDVELLLRTVPVVFHGRGGH